MITYLVSGAEDIIPSHENVRRAGRRVRHDTEVSDDAYRELKPGRRFIVIAHGNIDGTVKWDRSDWPGPRRWLYVGMKKPPKGTRMFLYSCCVGKKLPRALKKCVAFGPLDVVPMPVDDATQIVLAFLAQAERLLRKNAPIDAGGWTTLLGEYVNDLLVSETEKNEPQLYAITVLLMLRKALGYPD